MQTYKRVLMPEGLHQYLRERAGETDRTLIDTLFDALVAERSSADKRRCSGTPLPLANGNEVFPGAAAALWNDGIDNCPACEATGDPHGHAPRRTQVALDGATCYYRCDACGRTWTAWFALA